MEYFDISFEPGYEPIDNPGDGPVNKNKLSFSKRVLIFLLNMLIFWYLFSAIDEVQDKINSIQYKNDVEKYKYCNTYFNVDKNLVDIECLWKNNFMYDEYYGCQKDTDNCWNNGDNIYVNTCIDTKAEFYKNRCDKYTNFKKEDCKYIVECREDINYYYKCRAVLMFIIVALIAFLIY